MIRNTLLSTFLVVLLLTACAPAPATVAAPVPAATELPATEVPATIPAVEEIAFTDALGKEITLAGKPERIVSLAPSVTESLFAIGAGAQVVGRTDYCDYPQEVAALPSIGGFSASSISVESIIALEPDLVIGGSTYQAEVIQTLEASGIQGFVSQPGNLEGIKESLILFGRITGHEDQASEVVAEMQARLDAVKEAVAGIPADERPTVFYEVWHEPLMSANGSTVVGELIDFAGGVNIFASLPDEYPNVSVEEIVDVDPQFIIGPSSHGDQMTSEVIGARPGWENLSAVKNNAIYIVDGNMVSRASPRVVEVLDAFAGILHPELFK